mgnify:CR=1 FL=1
MDYTKRVIELRKMGHSEDYINGYLDGAFDTMKYNYIKINDLKDKIRRFNEEKAKIILGD